MRKITLAVLATVVAASVVAPPANAASKSYSVTAKFSNASGKTVLLLAKSGRVLARASLTRSNQSVTLKSPAVSSITGASLQLVTTSGGDYFGPVVLGWASKSKVYTAIRSTKASEIGRAHV